MGYTHQWKGCEFSTDQWSKMKQLARQILKATKVPVRYESDIPNRPVVNDDFIRFNGLGSAGCETFILERNGCDEFCKTGRYAYDEVVVAMLYAAAKVCPDFIWISDGDADEHEDGIALLALCA